MSAGTPLPTWVELVHDEDLTHFFGAATVRRGLAYQRQRAVLSIEGTGADALYAVVQGSRRYGVTVYGGVSEVSFSSFGSLVDLDSLCTCPVRVLCKHAVAALLEARDGHTEVTVEPFAALAADSRAATPPEPPKPLWESLLAPVVTASTAPAPTAYVPLGLLFEHVPAPRDRRLADVHRRRGHIQLRPVVRSAAGSWVRTGISWADLQYSYGRMQDPGQRAALAAIYLADRVRNPSYSQGPQWVFAQSLGPRLWRMLDDAADAGVEFVTGHLGGRPVRYHREPVELVLDARRDDDAALVVDARLDLPDHDDPLAGWLSAHSGDPLASVGLIGDPAHGLFLPSPGGLTLAPLAESVSPALGTLLGAGSITIPAGDVDRFLTHYYPALRQRAVLRSSDGSVELPSVEPPRLALDVTFEPGHVTTLHWSFRYAVGTRSIDAPLIPASPPRQTDLLALQPPDPPALVRDRETEEGLLESLQEVLSRAPGLLVPLPGMRRQGVVIDPVLTEWDTVGFVHRVLPALLARDDIDVAITGTPLDYSAAPETPTVTVATQDADADDPQARDWFDLSILVTVAGDDIELSTLLTAMGRGDEALLLPSGAWIALDSPELLSLRRLVEEARALHDDERTGEGLRISRFQVGLWEELVELGVVASQSARWQESVAALLTLDEVPHPPPPPSLTATLRSYQLDGYQWLSFLWDHALGGVLADDMGLGKTLQTLAMAERARVAGSLTPDAPLLVVAPTSVLSAWSREASKFTPSLRVVTIGQTQARAGVPLSSVIAGAHVIVTSYALFRIDADAYAAHSWSGLVLDEAQFVKNHQSKTYQAARRLPAPFKLAITGTPLENSLMDLWSLLSIVAPGLFPTPQVFSQLYRRPIESGAAPELLATLRRRIRPLMLRRTKSEVAADLPPKIEHVLSVPLNAAHQRHYDTHLNRERQRILGLLDEPDRNRIAILAALTKLRQLALSVHLVEPEAPPSIHSSKIEALVEQLVEVIAEGHRALVFSQFTRFLGLVRDRLAREGIDHVYLDGRTRDRGARIASFTEGQAPVFLISLKAGGSGLTLTEADYVFVLDPWWNPAVEAQAVDRTHRIGQDKTVMVYRLVSAGTIEEKVVALQEHKRDLFARVVDDAGLMSAGLTTADLRALLAP